MMKKPSRRRHTWTIFAVLFLVVSVCWALSWLLTVGSSHLSTWADRGSFGDMFGAVGALFSGLAFAGVILTVYYQTRELRLQRAAVEQTNEYLESLAEAQRSTDRAMCRLAKVQALAGMMQPEALAAARSVGGPSEMMKELQEKLNAIVRDADRDIARPDSLDRA